MSQSRKVAWRKAVVVGWLAASGAVFPLLATAQQNAEQPVPSGAAVEVGGVQARPAAAQGVQTGPVAVEGGQTAPGNVSGAQPQTIEVGGAQARPVGVGGAQTRPVEVAGAQSRPIVLPTTGGGPAPDDRPWEFALAALTAIGVGTYLRRRVSRTRLGD